ncbi:MAG: FAD:protein FMN transferase [Pirellulales bacterium]|nr:FAD:protein FMN transferase [Pirellulales bacterium]
MRRAWIVISAATWFATLAGPAQWAGAEEQNLRRHEYSQVLMGMDFRLTFYAADADAAKRAADTAFARVDALNRIMSDYDRNSELSRLSATAGSDQSVKISGDLWLVLSRSQQLARETGGAFDVTVGPLVRLWRRSRRQRELPSPERLQEALAATGHQHLKLDESTLTALLARHGMQLDLGGIAAGYAVDEALRILRENGFTKAMVDASGDIRCGDPPPGQAAWRVRIETLTGEAHHGAIVPVVNGAITTAGDAEQHVEIGGVRYSHIVDPKTGLGVTTPTSVTIMAADCLTADSLDTAIGVLPPDQGIELAKRHGASCLIVRRVQGELQISACGAFAQTP